MHSRTLIALLFALAASAAAAQPKPALVQDRDAQARNRFMQTLQPATVDVCNPVSCAFNFQAVPAGKRLVVTHVAVTVGLTGGGSAGIAALVAGADVMILPAAQRTLNNRQVLSAPVTFYVEAGVVPRVEFQYDAIDDTAYVQATLVGYFVDLP